MFNSTYNADSEPPSVRRGAHLSGDVDRGLTLGDSAALRLLAPRDGGMVFGMATIKITVTLQEAQLEEIRALVASGQAANVSAFVQHAVRVALYDAAGWREMLSDALQQTGGPLTKKERAWADALLSPQGKKRSSGKRKAA